MKIDVIESNRRSISISVTPEGNVVVRAPIGTNDDVIKECIQEKKSWILSKLKTVQKAQQEVEQVGAFSEEELKELQDAAKEFIPQRVALYAPLIGVKPNRITIRTQKTRWGSCSGKGNLNFNCLLMMAPVRVLDSVVVHELCHMKQMNHSKKFYEEVYRVFPEYKECHKWLDEHGRVLMKRVK